jgi:hypothetical protein
VAGKYSISAKLFGKSVTFSLHCIKYFLPFDNEETDAPGSIEGVSDMLFHRLGIDEQDTKQTIVAMLRRALIVKSCVVVCSLAA